MTTLKEISKEAFDNVAADITDVVLAASLEYDTRGPYNATTGTSGVNAVTTITGGRAVFGTSSAIANVFPSYTQGSDDVLISLEGFTTVPKIGWRIVANGTRTIKAVGDIVGAGTFFDVVAS